MLERPLGPDLLETAREVVLKELLPLLPPAQAFAARMVANAIGIATREAAQDPAWQRAALARMAALTGDTADPERAFAAAMSNIRDGQIEPPALKALQTQLTRAAEKAPKKELTRDDVLDLLSALERVGGLLPADEPRPQDAAAPPPP